MKNHRFLWLRNRTTDNRKCEKARNIKEKRTIEMFSTVLKRLVAHLSSPNVSFGFYRNAKALPGNRRGFYRCRFSMNKPLVLPGVNKKPWQEIKPP